MTVKGEPKITACKASDNWTSVTFKPDLAKFGMDHLEADTVALMRKRVYDLAGVLGKACKVGAGTVQKLCKRERQALHVLQLGLLRFCSRLASQQVMQHASNVAGCTSWKGPWHAEYILTVQVYLNGTRLGIKTFSEYVDLYLGPKENGVPRIYERVNDRWEICVSPTDGQFQQVCSIVHTGRPWGHVQAMTGT